jgi:hypothetical protein
MWFKILGAREGSVCKQRAYEEARMARERAPHQVKVLKFIKKYI